MRREQKTVNKKASYDFRRRYCSSSTVSPKFIVGEKNSNGGKLNFSKSFLQENMNFMSS